MHIVRSFLLVLLPASLLMACGDDGSTGSGGSGGSGASGGSGGSGATGGGGAGGGQGGSGGGATTTSEGGSGGGTTTTGNTTSSTTTGGMGACTNAEDTAVLSDPNIDIAAEVNTCAQENLGQEPATYDCIKALGLTDGCTQCFDDTVQCVIMNCLTECLSGPDSQACTDCRAMKCDPAFEQCSGLSAQ